MTKEWFVSRPGDSKRFGPYDDDKLKQLAEDGRLQPDDLVWKDGMVDWVEAIDLGGLVFELPPPDKNANSSPQSPSQRHPSTSNTDSTQVAAGVCALLVGYFGVHKFIIGATTAGVVMLLVTVLTCGMGSMIMWPIGFVEGIIYLTKSPEEFEEEYMIGKKGWF